MASPPLTRRQALIAGAATSLTATGARAVDEPWKPGEALYTDDFRGGLDQWLIEAEKPAQVSAADGVLDVDTPEGLSIWFRPELIGPIVIDYQAQATSAGGPNDRVSDLNCFWMATDPRSPGDLTARPRSGAFADYDQLQTYYVGQGGNANTSTRFRRYVGRDGDRPLLPENDRSAPEDLLIANAWQHVRLVAFGGLIQYWRDGRKVFEYRDHAPYERGWFALRTTRSHLRIRDFRVLALPPA